MAGIRCLGLWVTQSGGGMLNPTVCYILSTPLADDLVLSHCRKYIGSDSLHFFFSGVIHLCSCLAACVLQVGSVIRSPEMAALVPALLAAIADPNASTRPCLDTLLATTFINTIDAPSLALVVPVVHRGLRDRSGDTKKRAARIVGNMCSLTNDPKVRQEGNAKRCHQPIIICIAHLGVGGSCS